MTPDKDWINDDLVTNILCKRIIPNDSQWHKVTFWCKRVYDDVLIDDLQIK